MGLFSLIVDRNFPFNPARALVGRVHAAYGILAHLFDRAASCGARMSNRSPGPSLTVIPRGRISAPAPTNATIDRGHTVTQTVASLMRAVAAVPIAELIQLNVPAIGRRTTRETSPEPIGWRDK